MVDGLGSVVKTPFPRSQLNPITDPVEELIRVTGSGEQPKAGEITKSETWEYEVVIPDRSKHTHNVAKIRNLIIISGKDA